MPGIPRSLFRPDFTSWRGGVFVGADLRRANKKQLVEELKTRPLQLIENELNHIHVDYFGGLEKELNWRRNLQIAQAAEMVWRAELEKKGLLDRVCFTIVNEFTQFFDAETDQPTGDFGVLPTLRIWSLLPEEGHGTLLDVFMFEHAKRGRIVDLDGRRILSEKEAFAS